MSGNSIPFWEEAYQNENVSAFSAKPNATLREFEHLLNKQSKILEAGCGEGQNAIYLARNGYCNVDAFDISEHGIAKLRKRCRMDSIRPNAFTADLRTYPFEQKYDMVMSFGTLHFVKKGEWKAYAVPASEDISAFAVGLARDEEIKELYTDWEIPQFKSYTFEDEHPGVPKHLHASNKIVARKI